MANEIVLINPLLLVIPEASDDIIAAVTAIVGWIPLNSQSITINRSRETQRLNPDGGKESGKVLGGAIAGTMSIACTRLYNVSIEPGLVFEGIFSTPSGRFSFVIQPTKVAVPLATLANPQYTGNAVITGMDLWGPGGTSAAVINITCELDNDFAVWRV